jgi:hypothetical protein
MSDEECIHGLGPVVACVICNGRAKAERQAPDPFRYFAAKYDGQCAECHLPIHVGQSIAWRPGEPPIHEGCE